LWRSINKCTSLEISTKITSCAIARMSVPESNTQRIVFNHHSHGSRPRRLFKFDNNTRGIGKPNFFDNPSFEMVYELDNDTGGIGELEFFGNPKLQQLYELDNDTGGIGELEFFGNPKFQQLYELDNDTGGIGELEFFGNPRFGLV
jgi:hypothetical protein